MDDEILELIKEAYQPDICIKSEEIFINEEAFRERTASFMTEDRVRGVMYYGKMEDFIDPEKLTKAKENLDDNKKVLVYGVGAGFITTGNLYIYCDLARWEIQLRYRKGMRNFIINNPDEDSLKKIKRGFFLDWRISDKHKLEMFDEIDYVIDSNVVHEPNMITGETFREGLKQVVKRPFRLVPYFDPGVWGGQWMKEVCDLDKTQDNFAWSFDGVPEENSIYLRYGDVRVEIPAMDVVLYQPAELRGWRSISGVKGRY